MVWVAKMRSINNSYIKKVTISDLLFFTIHDKVHFSKMEFTFYSIFPPYIQGSFTKTKFISNSFFMANIQGSFIKTEFISNSFFPPYRRFFIKTEFIFYSIFMANNTSINIEGSFLLSSLLLIRFSRLNILNKKLMFIPYYMIIYYISYYLITSCTLQSIEIATFIFDFGTFKVTR